MKQNCLPELSETGVEENISADISEVTLQQDNENTEDIDYNIEQHELKKYVKGKIIDLEYKKPKSPFESINLPEFEENSLFADSLKCTIIEATDCERQKERQEEMIEAYPKFLCSLMESVMPQLTKIFEDGNISGEDIASMIPDTISRLSDSATRMLDMLYFRETPADRLLKLLQADNAYKDGVRKDYEILIDKFNASDDMLKLKFDSLVAELSEKIARAELAVFESSDVVLDVRLGTMSNEEQISLEKLTVEKFLASDDMLDLELKTKDILKRIEEKNLDLKSFLASEEVLSLELNIKDNNKQISEHNVKSALNEANLKEFEASEDVLKLKKLILDYNTSDAEGKMKLSVFESSNDMLKIKKGMSEASLVEGETRVKSIRAQILLTLKQYDGFALDTKVKMMGILFDGWSKGFMSGFEGVPAVISNDVMSTIFNTTSDISNGFNGGEFNDDIHLISQSRDDDKLSLSFAWDSGVTVGGDVQLFVTPSWTELEGYPKTVGASGIDAVTIPDIESDGTSKSVMIKVTHKYNGNPNGLIDQTLGEECCDIGCGEVPFIRSSTFIYSIRASRNCPDGMVYNSSTGLCEDPKDTEDTSTSFIN